MKIQALVLASVVFFASCNTKPQADNGKSNPATTADTTGLAEFQAIKAQNELSIKKEENKNQASSSTTAKKTSTGSSSASGNHSTTSSTGTVQKKGWSKTAKGAVIGGVVGAGTGAVINKKNRAAGAVVGGVIGAGTGAVIGNEMDKKDGRH